LPAQAQKNERAHNKLLKKHHAKTGWTPRMFRQWPEHRDPACLSVSISKAAQFHGVEQAGRRYIQAFMLQFRP